MQKKLKVLKKILMSGKGYILLGSNVKATLNSNGFIKGDIVSGIMKGFIINVHMHIGKESKKIQPCYVIEGEDSRSNLILIKLEEEGINTFRIISVESSVKKKLIV